MKLFKVSIDRNPGEWKSDSDPHVLVQAINKEEAIQKVKDGWDEKWNITPDGIVSTYMKMEKEFPIRDHYQLSASEILFDGYDIHIKTVRKAKLDRIEKNSKRDETK